MLQCRGLWIAAGQPSDDRDHGRLADLLMPGGTTLPESFIPCFADFCEGRLAVGSRRGHLLRQLACENLLLALRHAAPRREL
jgi:hypothetical protein